MAGDNSFSELKTFYQKADPVAPYATTPLIQHQQQSSKLRVSEAITFYSTSMTTGFAVCQT